MVTQLQAVIGQEIRKQLKEATGRSIPDILLACVGGGSNAAGTIFEFLDEEAVGIVFSRSCWQRITKRIVSSNK